MQRPKSHNKPQQSLSLVAGTAKAPRLLSIAALGEVFGDGKIQN